MTSKTLRCLVACTGGMIAAGALLSASASAQTEPAQTNQGQINQGQTNPAQGKPAQFDPVQAAQLAKFKEMAERLTKTLTAPDTPLDTPVTPERLAAARRLMATINFQQNVKALADNMRSQSEAQFRLKLQALSPKEQTEGMQAFIKAFDTVEAAHLQVAFAGMANYFARRLTVDEMQATIAYYSSGLGARLRSNPKSLSAEEFGQAGLELLNQPRVLKFTKVNLDYSKTQFADADARKAKFQTDFQAQLCRNLTTTHVKLSTCPPPAHMASRGM
ncbi:MAG: hypothetical protein WA840_08960 [Caulobacteraceae bacterium]